MLKINANQANLSSHNREVLESTLKSLSAPSDYEDFLRVVAEVLDACASGKDAVIHLGANKDKTSLSMTVKLEGAAATLYQGDLVGLSAACGSLL